MVGRQLCWLMSLPAGLPRSGSRLPSLSWRGLLGTTPPSAGASSIRAPVLRQLTTVTAVKLPFLPIVWVAPQAIDGCW